MTPSAGSKRDQRARRRCRCRSTLRSRLGRSRPSTRRSAGFPVPPAIRRSNPSFLDALLGGGLEQMVLTLAADKPVTNAIVHKRTGLHRPDAFSLVRDIVDPGRPVQEGFRRAEERAACCHRKGAGILTTSAIHSNQKVLRCRRLATGLLMKQGAAGPREGSRGNIHSPVSWVDESPCTAWKDEKRLRIRRLGVRIPPSALKTPSQRVCWARTRSQRWSRHQ